MISNKASIDLDINLGDTVLTGHWRNHKEKVRSIGKDKHGQPTINDRPILNIRLPKLMNKQASDETILLPWGRYGEQIPVFKNPSADDLEILYERYKAEVGNSFGDGNPRIRSTYDKQGNEYAWMSLDAVHSQIESWLEKNKGIKTHQNKDVAQVLAILKQAAAETRYRADMPDDAVAYRDEGQTIVGDDFNSLDKEQRQDLLNHEEGHDLVKNFEQDFKAVLEPFKIGEKNSRTIGNYVAYYNPFGASDRAEELIADAYAELKSGRQYESSEYNNLLAKVQEVATRMGKLTVSNKVAKSDKDLTVFLGGGCQTDWREAVVDSAPSTLNLIDPVDDDWDPKINIYRELTDLATADDVVFYKGGEGTEKEKEFLDALDKPYTEFTDVQDLTTHLQELAQASLKVRATMEHSKGCLMIPVPPYLSTYVLKDVVAERVNKQDLVDEGGTLFGCEFDRSKADV